MELTQQLILLLLVLSTFSLLPLHSQAEAAEGENVKGRWKLLRRSIGISAMHMQLLPNDKVIAYDRTDAGRSNISLPAGKCTNVSSDCTAHSVEFDPVDRRVRPLTVITDTFCSSGALSPNGTLVQTGGNGKGDHAVRYFAPCDDCDWTEDVNGLAVRRWYATDHILPDGRVFVVGGRRQFNYEFVPSADKKTFDLQFLVDTYDKPNLENNLYPFVHLSPDGNLFVFANSKSILLDYVNDKVVRYFPELTPGISRNYPSSGSSVLLPLRLDRINGTDVKAEVMVCGGADKASFPNAKKGVYLPADSSCGRIVITDEAPSWEIEQMPLRRVMGDMIMLPTGDVLIINGAANGTAGWTNGRDPVLSPVLYRTGTTTTTGNVTGVFETMSPSVIPRVYHSVAHLIADGRVLISGSNANQRYTFRGVPFPTELSMEAFFPPYLGGRRPKITYIAPTAEFCYADRFTIGFTTKGFVDCEDVYVTLVSPSFTTHSFSMNQRLLVLEAGELSKDIGDEEYKLEGVAPASSVLAPPGYYLVFVVHGGVPSKGMWVRIS